MTVADQPANADVATRICYTSYWTYQLYEIIVRALPKFYSCQEHYESTKPR